MSIFYAEMQAVADELIAEFGQQGTVTRISLPDPIEGGEGTETSYPAKLVPMAYSAREIDNTNILAGDMQIYISSVGLAIEPKPGDLVSASGKTFRIINGDPQNYDGAVNVVFICQARVHG